MSNPIPFLLITNYFCYRFLSACSTYYFPLLCFLYSSFNIVFTTPCLIVSFLGISRFSCLPHPIFFMTGPPYPSYVCLSSVFLQPLLTPYFLFPSSHFSSSRPRPTASFSLFLRLCNYLISPSLLVFPFPLSFLLKMTPSFGISLSCLTVTPSMLFRRYLRQILYLFSSPSPATTLSLFLPLCPPYTSAF